jgi:hypothetical protein
MVLLAENISNGNFTTLSDQKMDELTSLPASFIQATPRPRSSLPNSRGNIFLNALYNLYWQLICR